MELYQQAMDAVNGVIWHNFVLYVVLGVGLLFTIWSGFCQYRALTHGVQVTRGKYDDPNDPGAISHFQALSAALSATVGLGNIGGVATAIALGGPGAVFWMWIVGLVGMALKTTSVTLSMMYRNTEDPENPHGGPMWVAKKGFAEWGMAGLGQFIGVVFCITLLISAITGGNMFQAWNVGELTKNASGGSIPTVAVGILLAVIVGGVIIGGIKRIGSVAGTLVPFMCAIYLLAALYVLIVNFSAIPATFALIFKSAFSPLEAKGAFVGGTFAYALLWGMKRALFSSEAGQGSSPIAHSAAKTDEPVREAVVAGLEPFIDTLVVCTLTSLVILSTGSWSRPGEAEFATPIAFVKAQAAADSEANDKTSWVFGTPTEINGTTVYVTSIPKKNEEAMRISRTDWHGGEDVFVLARWGEIQSETNDNIYKVMGKIRMDKDNPVVDWQPMEADVQPVLMNNEIYREYPSAALTTYAFDIVTPGLGTWLVLLAAWLFAISTMISWSYYGEQGMIYLFGERSVLPYKMVYCLLIIVATLGFISTDKQLDDLTALGTGVMLWANIPIMLIFGAIAMRTYHNYIGRLKSGEMKQDRA